MNLISVETAASIIGCTVGRVRQLLQDGTELKGTKLVKNAWVVDKKSAEKYAKKPQPCGRPRKFPAA